MRALHAVAFIMISALPGPVLAQIAPPSAAQSAPTVAPTVPARSTDDPAARARFEKFRAACGLDLQAHCATVVRGTDQSRAEMRQCIDTNKARFSAGCQTALAERDAERAARKEAAPADVKPKG